MYISTLLELFVNGNKEKTDKQTNKQKNKSKNKNVNIKFSVQL